MRVREIEPRQSLALLFLVFIALYALFQARYIILGPRITILEPRSGLSTTTSEVTVSGTARNVTFISLDDRPIFLDQKGAFSETVLAPAGQSTIIVKARDRFGRETERTTTIVVQK